MKQQIIALFLLFSPFLAAQEYELLEEFDTFVETTLSSMNVPGASVAVIHKGEVIKLQGYGYRDIEQKLPVTEETLFPIGSISKTFTSLLLSTAVEKQQIDWNQPIIHYLKDFRVQDEFTTQNLTLNDLLTHQSGLAPHDALWYCNERLTRSDLIYRLRYLEPKDAFRSGFLYQSVGFTLAAYVLEEMLDKSFENLLYENILSKLEMESTHFSVSSMLASDNYASAYMCLDENRIPIPHKNISIIGGGGAMISNAKELSNYGKFLLAKGQYKKERIVSEETLASLFAPQVSSHVMTPSLAPDNTIMMESYGRGWFSQAYRGHLEIYHGGNVDGSSSLISLLPHDDLCVIVCTNLTASTAPYIIAREVYDRVLELDAIDWHARLGDQISDARSRFKLAQMQRGQLTQSYTDTSKPTWAFEGVYEHQGYGKLEVWLDSGLLCINYNFLSLPLEHVELDTFSVSQNSPIPALAGMRVSFTGENPVVHIPLEPTVKDIAFSRSEELTLSSPRYQKRLIGQYTLGGETLVIHGQNNTLFAKLPNHMQIELSPLKFDQFLLKGLEDNTIEFIRDDEGNINLLRFNRPSGSLIGSRID